MDAAAFGVVATIGVILLVSGVAKLRSGSFTADLENYRILPAGTISTAAAFLPWAEIIVGAGLIVGVFVRWLLLAAVLMILVFTAGVVVNLLRGRRINCGCRGAERPIGWGLVATNTATIAAGVAALWTWPAPVLQALAGTESRLAASDALAVLIVLAAGTVFARLILMWRHIDAVLATTEQRRLPQRAVT